MLMEKIRLPREVDYEKYQTSVKNREVLFGLPSGIEFCRECTYSNQKPNSEREYAHQLNTKKPTVKFDANGVCSACRVARLKRSINWEEREKMLEELCNKYRSSNGEYDCIVPGSGGKDSFYAAFILKYKYNMNPLTVTWAPHIYTPLGLG